MFYCYVLTNTSEKYKNCTYNGFTNNPQRRIRQHNGEIKGGAKCTTSKDPNWEIAVLIGGFPDNINALQCEWRIKKPDNKKRGAKYRGIEGRIVGVNEVLHLEQWTSKSTVKNADMKLTVWIKREYRHLLIDLPSNITLVEYETMNELFTLLTMHSYDGQKDVLLLANDQCDEEDRYDSEHD